MNDFENTLVRHIVGTGDAPEIRALESSTSPSPAVPIKGSIDEKTAGAHKFRSLTGNHEISSGVITLPL